MSNHREFIPLNIAILTISDSRTEDNDTSGHFLVEKMCAAGHHKADKRIVPDNIYNIRSILSQWIENSDIQVVITTGGTGLTGRDCTPEAVQILFDKPIEGFGELFRSASFEEIKTSTIQSRSVAGVANGTYIFCVPGSTGACKTAWHHILQAQLDYRTRPCNFVEMMPRLLER
ncbi:MAG: molybdenum cofactor biosynthesis protein B [Thiomargarita sp.]|nr:molybdenum cofactor biosynthesis protein B [Thiomargarita sp.]